MFDNILQLSDWPSWEAGHEQAQDTGVYSESDAWSPHTQHSVATWDVTHDPYHQPHPDHITPDGTYDFADVGDQWHLTQVLDDHSQLYTAGADFYGDIIGNPTEDAQFWHQQTSPTSCAVVAQLSVYESITGNDISEAEVCRIAEENGWYDPDAGTKADNVGKILNALGIPTEQHYNATLVEIADALERGDKVIVGLDSQEIWHPETDPTTGLPLEQEVPNSGHAVWVTGIEEKPDGSVKIILNDSGIPDGQRSEVDAEDFVNAWDDFSNQVVIAHAPQQTVIV